MVLYFFIGFLITFFVDLYTSKSNVKAAQFKNNRERLLMTILWPLFVVIVIYNFIKIIKKMRKNDE